MKTLLETIRSLNEAKSTDRAIYTLKGKGVQKGSPSFDDKVKIDSSEEKGLWDFVEENQHVTIEAIEFYSGDSADTTMVHFTAMNPTATSEWDKFTKDLKRYDRRIELDRYI